MSAQHEKKNGKTEKNSQRDGISGEKKRSLLEEMIVVLLAQKSAIRLAKFVETGDLSEDVFQVILKRAKKKTDNDGQEKLLSEIARKITGSEDEKKEAKDGLVALLIDQDAKVGVKVKGKKKQYETESEKMLEGIVKIGKMRETVTNLWVEVNNELEGTIEKLEMSEAIEVVDAIQSVRENIMESTEQGLGTTFTQEKRKRIKEDLKKIHQKYIDKRKNDKPWKKSPIDRAVEWGEEKIEVKGAELIVGFLEKEDDKTRQEYLNALDENDYYIILRFGELSKKEAEASELSAIYEAGRRMEEMWDKEKASEVANKMSKEDNERLKDNAANPKMPEFETTKEAIKWMYENDVRGRGVEGKFISEQAKQFFRDNLDQLGDVREMAKNGGLARAMETNLGRETYRNMNYRLLLGVNKQIEQAWREAGYTEEQIVQMSTTINVEALKKGGISEKDAKEGWSGGIDLSAVLDGSGGPRVSESMPKEAKKILEQILFQELLKEQRILVSNSVERASMYYDQRAERYLTLLTVGGVDNTIKDTATNHMIQLQLQYAFRNNFVDEKMYEQIMNLYSRQGPEYRLHEELKRVEIFELKNKEGAVVEKLGLSQFDYDGWMSQNVPQELKDKLGMYTIKNNKKVYVDRTWGTVLARSTDSEVMTAERKIFIEWGLKQKYGPEKYAEIETNVGKDGLLEQMTKNYGDYINRTYLYWIGTGKLGEVVGNASYDNSVFELPQGIPEYYAKRDPRLLVWFFWKYSPLKVPEALLGMARMGIPSFHAKLKKETAAHFISIKGNQEGAKGIKDTFYIDNPDMTKEEKEELDKHAMEWAKLFEGSLFNMDELTIGKNDKNNSLYKKMKDSQTEKFAPRKNATKTIEELVKFADSHGDEGFFNSINWEWAIKTYQEDKELVGYLSDDGKTGREKFRYFAEHFNDGRFVTTALKAKDGDDAMKYRVSYQGDFMAALIEYANNPEPANLDVLMQKVRAIVGGGVVEFRDVAIKVVYDILRKRDPGELLEVIEYKNGQVKFGDSFVGENAGEFPMPAIKKIVHDPRNKDIETNSVAQYRGLNKAYEKDMLMDMLLRNMRGGGHFPDDDEYIETRKEWRKEMRRDMFGGSLKWQEGAGVVDNLVYNGKQILDIVTLKKAVEYVAINIVRLPPEMFLEWLFENSEHSLGTIFKYMNS